MQQSTYSTDLKDSNDKLHMVYFYTTTEFFFCSLMPQMVFPHFLSLRISSHRLSGSTASNSRSHFTMRNSFLMGNSIHVLITTTITSESDQRRLESRWTCAGVGVYASPCGRKHSRERHWCKNQLVRLWTWPCLSWLFEKTETFHMFTVCGFHSTSELNTTWETG